MSDDEKIGYDELIAIGERSLADGEMWCIFHPDGLLEMTASKDLTFPVRTVCNALNADWDDLREQGFYLGKISA